MMLLKCITLKELFWKCFLSSLNRCLTKIFQVGVVCRSIWLA
ncbi:hypothetical protein IC582_021687 [Cucumis melo]